MYPPRRNGREIRASVTRLLELEAAKRRRVANPTLRADRFIIEAAWVSDLNMW